MVEFFINYRSSDGAWAANMIESALAARLDAGSVFLDTSSIPLGDAFPQYIWKALQNCRTLLAVIGPRWLDSDAGGARRIDDERDLVRREIATALRRDIRVIPVLLDGTTTPSAELLPADIVDLARRQAVHLRGRGARQDVELLADKLTGRSATPGRDHRGATMTTVIHGDVHADTIGVSYRGDTRGDR
jgi:hypothetical protein